MLGNGSTPSHLLSLVFLPTPPLHFFRAKVLTLIRRNRNQLTVLVNGIA